MKGTITGRDVIRYTATIVRFWGLACYYRCLRAIGGRRRRTFLEVLSVDCAAFRTEPISSHVARPPVNGRPGEGR